MKNTLIKIISLSTLFSPIGYADPFQTGDSDTTPCNTWAFEFNGMVEYPQDEPNEKALSLELKRGVLDNLEIFAALSYGWASAQQEAPALNGAGDSELGIKWRLLEEKDQFPAIAFNPTLLIPTGISNNDDGNQRVWVELPLWLEKEWNSWVTSFGGGAAFNSSDDARNYGFAGWKLAYHFTPKLTLGAELFYQGADSTDSSDFLLFNIGGDYQLTKAVKLEFSAGHNITGETLTIGYLGIAW